MLKIDEIIKMSNKIGIEIRDSQDGRHYILDDSGKEKVFNTDMLINLEQEDISLKVDLKTTIDFDSGGFSREYKLTSCKTAYKSYPSNIDESITYAA